MQIFAKKGIFIKNLNSYLGIFIYSIRNIIN